MARTIVAPLAPMRQLAPGVELGRMQPGGRRGPNGEVLGEEMGGQVWSQMFMFGGEDGSPPLCVPDIRLPANQYWPLHWHDCWIAVIVLEGDCLIGDWHMRQGDVLISEDGLEYGPLLIGPAGCQMFEIFARLYPNEGGYAPEFRDHPTLAGTTRNIQERSARNAANAGRQVVSVEGTPGLTKGRLVPGQKWDLGPGDDPGRAVLECIQLAPGEALADRSWSDWHGLFVIDGELTVGGTRVESHGVIRIAPSSTLPELVAGPGGARLLEVSRTAEGAGRRTPKN
jgi:hypothetical protein